MKKIILLLLLIVHMASAQDHVSDEKTSDAQAKKPFIEGFIYGLGFSSQQQIYKGFDQRNIAIPLVGYVGEKIIFFGPFINYIMVQKNNWQVDFNLEPRFNGFDETDSDFFTGMDDRKDSLDAGFSLKYKPNSWSYQIKAVTDVLSRSKGSEFEFNITKKFKFKGIGIEPSVSFNQLDGNLTDYYYGVKNTESTADRAQFIGSSTLNKKLKLTLSAPTPIGLLRLDLNNTWYGSGITRSPLVQDDSAFGARLVLIRKF